MAVVVGTQLKRLLSAIVSASQDKFRYVYWKFKRIMGKRKGFGAKVGWKFIGLGLIGK